MTLASSPWAVDGARVKSSTARAALFAESGSAEGVGGYSHLKVTALAVPGVGVTIAEGAVLILNRYQSSPNQTYSANNIGPTDLNSTNMPPSSPAAQSHLVCVVIGDPEFSAVGHPFMPATPIPDDQKEDYQYARFFVIPNVPATTKNFAQLGLSYPAYALARIDVPANTSTITNSMIVDLRKIARPRATEEVFTAASSSSNLLGNVVGTYENWPPSASFSVDIPDWATTAKIQGFVESAIISKAVNDALRITIVGAGSTAITNINESAPASGTDRIGWNAGGSVSIPANLRGTTATIKFEGVAWSDASRFGLATDASTGALIRVRFEEKAI